MYRRIIAWPGRSLRRKLLLASISTMLLVLTLLGSLSFLFGRAAIRAEVETRNAQLATLVAQTVGAQFDNRLNNLALLIAQLQTADTAALQAQALVEFRLNAPTVYRALYLIEADGRVKIDVADAFETLLVLTDTSQLLDRGDISQPAVKAAFASARSGAIFISPTRLDPSDQVPTTLVGLPVVNGQGMIASVLVAEIDGRNLWRSIDAIQLGRTGRVFVASAEGIIIAHPERNYIGQTLAPELRKVVENFEGQTEYHDALSDRLMLAAYSPVSGRSGWSIIVEQESIEALAPINAIAFLTMVVLLLALGSATIVTFGIARSITRPLQKLVEATHHIAQTSDLTEDIPVTGTDEVNQLAGSFNGMIAALRGAREHLLGAQTVAQELRIAREIQTSLLPAAPPHVPGLDIAAHCLPAKEIGGDFFGYYRLAANHTASRELIVTVGDVSGKGIPAALYMAVSSSALATQVALSASIVELYAELNLILHPRTAQTRINTALLTVHLDTHDEQWFAHIVNAGLIAPLHRRNGVSSYLDVGGLPLGAVPGAQYQHLDQPLCEGDWLVLCSDGIIEAMNCDREIYGFERLQAHVSTSAAQTAAALVTTIMQDIEAFTGGADQHDDMTVVVIRVVAAGAAE